LKGFLFDENIPLLVNVPTALPLYSTQALGSSPTDSHIWNTAKLEDWVIVSKDTDFSHRMMLSKPPPWIIHIRVGNMRKKQFNAFIEKVWPEVEKFLPSCKIINVYADRIDAIRS